MLILLNLCLLAASVVNGKFVDRKNILGEIDEVFKDDSPKLAELLKDLIKEKFSDDDYCKDKSTDCKAWKAAGACEAYIDDMRQHCRKTCDLCKPPAPPIPQLPLCATMPYGCCWNNKTAAKGPTEDLIASQCPPCLNSQSNTFCNGWKSDCNSEIIGQGDVMRERCPVTCEVPCDYNLNVHKCKDKSPSCNAWFREGKCQTEKKKMEAFCPSLCGFC